MVVFVQLLCVKGLVKCLIFTDINPAGTDGVCKRVSSYQSPEPALFTVNVPALDGGKRHRVGVLQTERKPRKDFNQTGRDLYR